MVAPETDARVLARVRGELSEAVAAHVRRRRRRRSLLVSAAMVVATLVIVGVAAGSPWLFPSAAPRGIGRELRQQMRQITAEMRHRHRSAPSSGGRTAMTIPVGRAVEVARTGDWRLYLLRKPQVDCFSVHAGGQPHNADQLNTEKAAQLSFAGGDCGPPTAIPAGTADLLGSEWMADPRLKDDPRYVGRPGSGYFFGFVNAGAAVTIEIHVPRLAAPLRAPVDPETHYFIVPLSADAWRVFAPADAFPGAQRPGVTPPTRFELVARDASGTVVARG